MSRIFSSFWASHHGLSVASKTMLLQHRQEDITMKALVAWGCGGFPDGSEKPKGSCRSFLGHR